MMNISIENATRTLTSTFIILLFIGAVIYFLYVQSKKQEKKTMMRALEIINHRSDSFPMVFNEKERETIELACNMCAYRKEGMPNYYAQSIAIRFRSIANDIRNNQLRYEDVLVIKSTLTDMVTD